MKPRSPLSSFVFASLLGATTLLPVASAFADAAPNAVNNATMPKDSIGNTGPYDGYDRFLDSTGRPLPGWEYLFNSPG